MRVAKIILPNQLFYNHSFFDDDSDYYLVEEYLFFRQYCFHKIKIAFHRASMRRFNNELSSNSKSVTYVEAQSNLSRIENLVGVLDKKYDFIEIFNPVDDWLNKRIKKSILVSSLKTWDNPSFINSNNNNKSVFTNDKHKYLHNQSHSIAKNINNIYDCLRIA